MTKNDMYKTDDGARMLLTESDPHYRKPKPVVMKADRKTINRLKGKKEPGIVRLYFSYMREVVLS